MADRGKQPVQGDWVTVARRAHLREEKTYVVFTGFQPGIYKTWEECHPQVNHFPGACYKSYDSMTKARRAWYSRPPMVSAQQMEFTPPMVIPPVRPIGVPMNIVAEPEIKYFYNPGIPSPVYEHLNAVWKGHVSRVKAKFRQSMAGLADELAKQAVELSNIKKKQNETNPLQSKFVIPNLDPEEYWMESLLRLSQHAAQIQGTVPTPFMVTDGRRIFVTNFPISYKRSEEQIQEVEALLNNIKKRQNLDLPMELTIQADSIEEDRNMQFSQDPNSPVSSEHYDGVEDLNLINQMED
ncbi:hypothetical protein Vadar_006177 [Vaccinium darrowii]|uniref:Uncharacterized protein n=1 Tax=Vaccinium darrowii TaxID=229202 RepID=A0ACB7YJC3_9ERIC|nr:hypothetical protein Vadar_006177 [Vaccinium darrowii]